VLIDTHNLPVAARLEKRDQILANKSGCAGDDDGVVIYHVAIRSRIWADRCQNWSAGIAPSPFGHRELTSSHHLSLRRARIVAIVARYSTRSGRACGSDVGRRKNAQGISQTRPHWTFDPVKENGGAANNETERTGK
jgi:hypothetical protein